MNVRVLTAVLAAGVALTPAVRPVVAAQTKPAPAAAAAAPRLVVLTVTDPVGEKMSYSRSIINAKPGERLKVRLMSMGQLPRTVMTHNFVLLTAGSDPKKFSDAAALTPATGYIPAALKSQILAQADMVGPGETSEVVFTAPKTPGSYPFLCTFAAHFAAGMTGTLVVK